MDPFGEADDPRRRLLIQALAAGFFTGGLAGGRVLAADLFGSTPSKLPAGRSIYRLSGKVTVDGKPATLDTVITPTSTVETGNDGQIVFVSEESAYILRADSRMVLERKQTESFFSTGLRLVTGKLLSVFPKKGPIQLRTATATIGIRGTGVYMESDPEQTYFCTCYGVADIASNKDPASTTTVTATHHDRPLYVMNEAQSGKNIRNAPFINHTDQELSLIETLVGRKTPFVFSNDAYTGPRRTY